MYVAHTAWILIDLDCSGFWVLKEKTEAFFFGGGGGFPFLLLWGFALDMTCCSQWVVHS
jgi:hypothetical protein